MPRAARVLVDNGYYHAITRGNDKRKLFRRKKDYKVMIAIMQKYLKKHMVDIIHYCLMPNHIHLLIASIKGEALPKFMQGVLQVYAHYYKKTYNSVGFVYQNRYKSMLIQNERYLIDCASYIENNPVRAKIVKKPEDYEWSSYRAYAFGKKDPLIGKLNPLYSGLGRTDKERQEAYIEYVNKQQPYEDIVDEMFEIQ
ncbi:MAG: transposase [Candidatus Omnitrophota bacterium]